MTQQQVSRPEPVATLPQQVWITLNPSQQKTVLQTLIQMCYRLVTQPDQEKKDEPVSGR